MVGILKKRCGMGGLEFHVYTEFHIVFHSISGISHGIRLWLDAALQRMLTRGFSAFV